MSSSIHLPLMWSVPFFPALFVVCVVQSCHGWICLKYLHSAWGLVVSLLARVLCHSRSPLGTTSAEGQGVQSA
jgi:hypothetical protein